MTRPGAGAPIIFLNYAVDEARRPRHLAALATAAGSAAYALTDTLAGGDDGRVRILVNKTRELSSDALARFPALRGICLSTAEDWMLTFDRASSPIRVRSADVERGSDVAEVAVLLMLAGLKRLTDQPRWHTLRSPGRFYRQLFPPPATETTGGHNWSSAETWTAYRKTIGIVGYGLIAHAIHRRLSGFGAEVLYHHPKRFSSAIEKNLGIEFREIESLFRKCDVIFVQLPLTEATRGLVGQAELDASKPDLVLVNCGRAAVIDKRALAAALRARRIGFYGADVFWREPMPLWDEFRRLRNALITPHFSESVVDPPRHEQAVSRALAALIAEIDTEDARN